LRSPLCRDQRFDLWEDGELLSFGESFNLFLLLFSCVSFVRHGLSPQHQIGVLWAFDPQLRPFDCATWLCCNPPPWRPFPCKDPLSTLPPNVRPRCHQVGVPFFPAWCTSYLYHGSGSFSLEVLRFLPTRPLPPSCHTSISTTPA